MACTLGICGLLLALPPQVDGAGENAKSRASQADATGDDLQQALQKRDQIIENLLRRVEMLEQKVISLQSVPPRQYSQPVEASFTAQVSGGQPERAAEEKQDPTVQPPPAGPADQREEEESIAQAALERVLIRQSALLLSPWTLEVEPSLTYAHTSSDRIIVDGVAILDVFGIGLVVGEIVSERIRRDLLLSALTLRLGLPWDLQIESRIPYRYESDRVVTADFAERTDQNHGLGDVEFALSRQITREKGWIPDLVGNLRWKTTTGETATDDLPLGTGFHSVQALLSTVKAIDPLVFFGGVSYTANIADDIGGLSIDPGDTWGVNLGAALALNPETSINFQWDQRFTNHSTAAGDDIPGSELTVGVFRIGFTYALARNMFLDLGVGIGLTDDSPAMQASIALPIRIDEPIRDSLFGDSQ
jgi:hypothetical protein